MNILNYVSRLNGILTDMECGSTDAADARVQIAKLNAEAERSNLPTVGFTDAQLSEIEELYEEESSSYEEESSY